MKRSLLTLGLALALCLGLLPAAALAAETAPDPDAFEAPVLTDLSLEKRADGCANLVFGVDHPQSVVEAYLWYMDNGAAEGLMVGDIDDPCAEVSINGGNWTEFTAHYDGDGILFNDSGCIFTSIPYEDLAGYRVQLRLYYTGYCYDSASANAWGIRDWFGDQMGKYSNVLTLEPSKAPVFSDVPNEAWYAVYVNEAVDLGLLKGKGEGKFAPKDNMTIAEAITLASRFDSLLQGEETDPGAGYDGTGPWYQPYVNYAWSVGLPWEYDDYNAKITRDQFAHIFAAVYQKNRALYEAEGIVPANTVADGAIPDVPMSHPYAGDIYLLYRLGVLTGSDAARSFLPASNIQRSEVAAILMRLADPDYLQHFAMP